MQQQHQQQQQRSYLEAQDAVERGKVQVLVLVDGGVLLSVHQPTGVPLRSLRKIGVCPENVRVDVVSYHVLNWRVRNGNNEKQKRARQRLENGRNAYINGVVELGSFL